MNSCDGVSLDAFNPDLRRWLLAFPIKLMVENWFDLVKRIVSLHLLGSFKKGFESIVIREETGTVFFSERTHEIY